MRAEVVLATNNAKKLTELRALVAEAGLNITVLGLADVEPYPEPAETEPTFEGNALIKAGECARRTGRPSLADDSGLEVDALNGMPGVLSARWSGTGDDAANSALVLAQLADVPDERRGARFVCAIALVLPDGREQVLRRSWEGRLVREPRGVAGFGYDPVFLPSGHDVTSAELAPVDKNAISHRGQAVRAMLPVLAEAVALDQKGR